EAVLNRLLPPYNMTVSALAKMEGISEATLYNWRKDARLRGRAVPGPKPNNTDQWSAEAKLATVIETASLSEAQLNEYCREKGSFVEQVTSWKEAARACLQTGDDQDKVLKQRSRAAPGRVRHVLRRSLHCAPIGAGSEPVLCKRICDRKLSE